MHLTSDHPALLEVPEVLLLGSNPWANSSSLLKSRPRKAGELEVPPEAAKEEEPEEDALAAAVVVQLLLQVSLSGQGDRGLPLAMVRLLVPTQLLQP